MAKKYFKLYTEYKKTLNLLSKRQIYFLIMALIDYVDNGTLPSKMKPKTMMVFNALKPIIDGDIEYERIRQERIRAGRISYRRRKNQKTSKNQQNYSKIIAK